MSQRDQIDVTATPHLVDSDDEDLDEETLDEEDVYQNDERERYPLRSKRRF